MSVTPSAFTASLINLLNTKKVAVSKEFLFLPGQEHSVTTREKRFPTSSQKRAELLPLLAVCRWLPWVSGVAITGSLAMNNADEHADADVMIITENNRLWLVRPLMVLFSFLYGKGDRGTRKENSWCLNLWLEQVFICATCSTLCLYCS
jgi:hypothetical protein